MTDDRAQFGDAIERERLAEAVAEECNRLADKWTPLAGGRSLQTESVRVESAYCASCGETKAVWTGPKHRECIQCGSVVYDDHETYIKVGKQIGGRYVDTATDRSDDDLRTDGGEQLGDEAEHRPMQHAEVDDDA